MRLDNIQNHETHRPSISEKELSQVKELSAAPKEIASPADETKREKLQEAKSIIASRLEQQKGVIKPISETKATPESTQFKPSVAVVDGKLNRGADISFKSNGPCERLCLKCKVEVGFRY